MVLTQKKRWLTIGRARRGNRAKPGSGPPPSGHAKKVISQPGTGGTRRSGGGGGGSSGGAPGSGVPVGGTFTVGGKTFTKIGGSPSVTPGSPGSGLSATELKRAQSFTQAEQIRRFGGVVFTQDGKAPTTQQPSQIRLSPGGTRAQFIDTTQKGEGLFGTPTFIANEPTRKTQQTRLEQTSEFLAKPAKERRAAVGKKFTEFETGVSKRLKEGRAQRPSEVLRREREGGATPVTPLLNLLERKGKLKPFQEFVRAEEITKGVQLVERQVLKKPVTRGIEATLFVSGGVTGLQKLRAAGKVTQAGLTKAAARVGLTGKITKSTIATGTFLAESKVTKEVGERIIDVLPGTAEERKLRGGALTAIRLGQAEIFANIEGGARMAALTATGKLKGAGKIARGFEFAKTRVTPGIIEGTISGEVLLEKKPSIDVAVPFSGGKPAKIPFTDIGLTVGGKKDGKVRFLPKIVEDDRGRRLETGRLLATSGFGAAGAGTAAAFGFVEGIAFGSRIGRGTTEVIGAGIDAPAETLGDAFTDTVTGVRTRTIVPTTTLGLGRTPIKQPKVEQPIKIDTLIKETPKRPRRGKPIAPQRISIKELQISRTRQKAPTAQTIKTPIEVPGKDPIKDPIKDPVKEDVKVEVPTEEQFNFDQITKTFVNVPRKPLIIIPPVLPGGGGGSGSYRFRRRSTRGTKYVASLFQPRKGKKKLRRPDFLTGLEVRPILRRF